MVVRTHENPSTGITTTTRRLLIAAGALVLVGAVVFAVARPAPQAGSTRSLPSFHLERLGGGTVTGADLHGHPVVVNFFASWCKPCKQEVGRLQRAYEANRARGIRFLGVATNDVTSDTRAFVDRHRLTYPVVLDPHGTLASKMRVYGLPETFFVEPDGSYQDAVRGHRIGSSAGTVVLGSISDKRLRQGIHGLLQGDGGS